MLFQLAYAIIDNFFSTDDEENIIAENDQFAFNPSASQNVPSEGFSFQ